MTCADNAQKGLTKTMTNKEAATTENTATVAEQGAHVAPAKTASKKAATPQKNAPKAKKGAKKANPKKQAKGAAAKAVKPKEAPAPRESSKKAIILELLRRPKGATLSEIMAATNWQAHSVRGFISGTIGKKLDLPVVSAKREDGERVYSLAK